MVAQKDVRVVGLVRAGQRGTLEKHVTIDLSNRERGSSEAPQSTSSSPIPTFVFPVPYYAFSHNLAMISSGFTNAPVSKFLVFSTVIGALLATITDTRYYLHISVVPHIWNYGQFWRFLTWQVCPK